MFVVADTPHRPNILRTIFLFEMFELMASTEATETFSFYEHLNGKIAVIKVSHIAGTPGIGRIHFFAFIFFLLHFSLLLARLIRCSSNDLFSIRCMFFFLFCGLVILCPSEWIGVLGHHIMKYRISVFCPRSMCAENNLI